VRVKPHLCAETHGWSLHLLASRQIILNTLAPASAIAAWKLLDIIFFLASSGSSGDVTTSVVIEPILIPSIRLLDLRVAIIS